MTFMIGIFQFYCKCDNDNANDIINLTLFSVYTTWCTIQMTFEIYFLIMFIIPSLNFIPHNV